MKYPQVISCPESKEFRALLNTLSLNDLRTIIALLYRLYGVICDASDFNKRIPLWRKSQIMQNKVLQQRVTEWQRQIDRMYRTPYTEVRALLLFCHANYYIPEVCKTHILQYISMTLNEMDKHQPMGE